METTTVDVVNLKKGDRVALLGSIYEVTYFHNDGEGIADVHLSEVDGYNEIILDDVFDAKFERIEPDPEEFRVRSTSNPEDFYLEFEMLSVNDGVLVDVTSPKGSFGMVVDKADLKAVVEKL